MEASVPRPLVFASLKGGVGRTTAACVAATHLCRAGKNVLVLDMDLEAPGLGDLMLRPNEAPRLGMLDYFVESGLRDDPLDLIGAMVARSFVTGADTGRLDVVPAVGTATVPENFNSKLARALLDTGADGTVVPLRTKAAKLVSALTERASYDAVLVDARAGLGELTAGPMLGLGAKVLLFGTAQLQTITGLRYLFAHLSSLVPPEHGSPWDGFRVVLAKAPPDHDLRLSFLEDMHGLFTEYLYEELGGLDGFNYAVQDPEAPHYPIPIALNPLFGAWDPAVRPGDLAESLYRPTFETFLKYVDEFVGGP